MKKILCLSVAVLMLADYANTTAQYAGAISNLLSAFGK